MYSTVYVLDRRVAAIEVQRQVMRKDGMMAKVGASGVEGLR